MKAELHAGLRRCWETWKRLAHRIGTFQARVLLTVIYAIVVPPFAICVRLFSDPLRIKKAPAEWLPCKESAPDIESARKQ
jgi:hypothetical protein